MAKSWWKRKHDDPFTWKVFCGYALIGLGSIALFVPSSHGDFPYNVILGVLALVAGILLLGDDLWWRTGD